MCPLLIYFFRDKTYLIIFLTIILTLFSGKRGALVIELVLLIYTAASSVKFQKLKVSSIGWSVFLFIAVLVIGYFAYEIAFSSFENRLMDFYQGTERGGEIRYGSGRSVFWQIALNSWYEKSIFYWFFGLGFFSTSISLKILYGLPIQAHNDFIEILHCFGLIGFITYLMFYFRLVSWIYNLPRATFYRYISLFCFLIFLGRSFFAGTLYRPDTIFLSVSMGFIFGNILSSYERSVS